MNSTSPLRLTLFMRLILVAALAIVPVAAQERPKQDDDQAPVRLNSTLVQVPAIVTDHTGKFVTDLTKPDFTVFEDGKRQEVALFTAIKQPFNAVLLLDTSNSSQDRLRAIQQTAMTFTQLLGTDDRMMVISFDNDIHELTEFTKDQKALAAAINGAESGFGKLLYEAMVRALEQLRDREGRRAVVLFSDGVDMKSIEATAEKTLKMAEEINAVIYVVRFDTRWWMEAEARKQAAGRPQKQLPFDVDGRIPLPPEYGGPDLSNDNPEIPSPGKPKIEISVGGIGTPRHQPPVIYEPGTRPPLTLPTPEESDPITENLDKLYGEADQFMLTVTSRTGGRVYRAETFENTRSAFAAIADELHNLYVLGYYPASTRRDNKLHKLKVEVARKNLQVRARSGYQTQNIDNRR